MKIAEWLQPHIMSVCPYCKTPIVNNENLTDRYCPNPQCPGHMACKISDLATRFGVKGVGPAEALNMIRRYDFKYHIQALSQWFIEKPKLYLYEVGEVAMIKGYNKQWRELCSGKKSMLQVALDPETPSTIRANYPLLKACEAEIDVKPSLDGIEMPIMMSGSFDGYRARADFVAEMNRRYGSVVQLVDVGKRKTGVSYLVKEAHSSDHEKTAIAHECGIEILTPAEMEERLRRYYTYIIEGKWS